MSMPFIILSSGYRSNIRTMFIYLKLQWSDRWRWCRGRRPVIAVPGVQGRKPVKDEDRLSSLFYNFLVVLREYYPEIGEMSNSLQNRINFRFMRHFRIKNLGSVQDRETLLEGHI